MKKYYFGFVTSLVGLALALFTPEYQYSTGGSIFEVCDEGELLGNCRDGVRELVWDGIEINHVYLALYLIGVFTFIVGFVYLVGLTYKRFFRKSR